ncbi:hypothetical protein N658DRAFT_511602 [Parathielavia hyrcaniae]|uniref:Uncharacterized protein n=1 Tax=Parathielavia hyrcaniae TaxID=113614 RepID=A0AAN6PQA5_9PEZI|nr:hypothetical protein N658DRAFT_511602 [Parathielavia hyrcaniae]
MKSGHSAPASFALAAVLPAEEDLSENAVDAIKQALLEYILRHDYVVPYCIAVVFIGGRTGTYWYVRKEGFHLSGFPEDTAVDRMQADQREENDPASSHHLRDMPLRIPLALFQALWPKERGYEHVDLGYNYLERDIHYIERHEGGEEVSVTIPWKDTRLYLVKSLNLTVPQAMCVVLYALPPAVASSGGPNNAETPWGRGISDVAMGAVMHELDPDSSSVWEWLVGEVPPKKQVKGDSTKDANQRVTAPEGAGGFQAAMLVLLPGPGSDDERHTPGRALAGEFECEKIRDLKGPAVASPSKHIVAEKQVD